jgi:outer membrane murein-binding lipoprotein Lpp
MDLEPPPSLPLDVTAPSRVPGWRNAALVALVAFVAGLAAMAVAFHYRDRWMAVPPSATVATQPSLSGTATGAMVTATTPLAAPGTSLDALATREGVLAAKLEQLEARTAATASDAQTASGNAGRAEALLITFAARRALDRGQPLGYIEEQLRARFGAAHGSDVGAVLQTARDPVTLEDLRASLDGVAPLLVTGAASDGWTASFRREIGNLITIHRAAAPSTLPADRMTRARRLLEAGQVEAALAEVARMPGAASAAAWIGAARRYVGARQALDRLEAVAIGGPAAARS